MTIFNVFSLLGGLALFLFGMDIMGKALEKQAGGQLQKILSKLTDNPLKGFFLGLCVTAVIQSSSATTVMVVGFVNSGIMELHQAIGVIMGSNVGTTVTSWILSLSGLQGDSLFIQLLKPTSFSPVLAFIGILLYMCKSEKKKGVGTILIGFAVLMTGMTTMSNAVLPLQNEAWFTSLFTRFSNPLLGVLVGALVTGIIQSSSASVGILQALSATGVITYGSAIPIIMGQNIGTCVTALLSSVGANKNARRAAMVHLYFNIIGVTIFLFGFYGLNAVCHFAFVNTTIEAWGIAIVHSVFNILATVILLPFATGLEKLAILTIPDSPEKEEFALLDDRLLNTPAVAVERARAATAEMAELARVGVVQAMSLTHEWNDELAQKVRDEECRVDRYEDALGTYLVKLSGRELNHTDSQSVNTLLHTINGFLAAAVGFSMVMLLNDDDRITFHLSPAFLALVAFCFSMTIGVLWEFFEFGMDFFLGTDMQKDTVIHAIHSVSLDPTLSNKVVTIPDIQDVVINGESLGLGGYLDIGIIDSMKDLFVNFIGAVVFSLSGFFFARSKGRRKSAAQGFVPSKKTAEQDYLQQALEEADQKDADAPTPDGPPAPGAPEGA